MRLILRVLAAFNLRWARADVERAVWHDHESVVAYGRAEARMALAFDQMARAGIEV